MDLEGHDVVVTVSGPDRVWSFARTIRVPRAELTNAVALARRDLRAPWLRWAGTEFPGVIKAGRYRARGGGLEFWMVRKAERVLVIETSGRFRRVVVETDDPDGDAARILAAR